MTSSTFSVTAVSDRIRLGQDRHGSARFTAVNNSPRAIRGVARVIPLGDTQTEWFSIDGDAQRPFAPGASQEFEVMVQVAESVAAGEYRFRLDVIGVENPDDDYGRGPDATVVVAALPRPPAGPRGKGYVAAMAGSVAGGVIGALVGTLPGVLFLISALHQSPPSSPNESFGEAIAGAFASALAEALAAGLLLILGVLIGVWVGPVLGAFVALRVRAQTLVGLTVGIQTAFQPIFTVILIVLLVTLGNGIKNQTTAVIAVLIGLGLVDIVVPALLARGAARLIRLRQL